MPHAKAEPGAGRQVYSGVPGEPNAGAARYDDPAVKARAEVEGLGEGKRQCGSYVHFHLSFTIGTSSKEAGQSPDGELRHRTPSVNSGTGTCCQIDVRQTIVVWPRS